MTSNEKRMLEREALRSVIQQWNANRLDLFELSEPDEVRFLYIRFSLSSMATSTPLSTAVNELPIM